MSDCTETLARSRSFSSSLSLSLSGNELTHQLESDEKSIYSRQMFTGSAAAHTAAPSAAEVTLPPTSGQLWYLLRWQKVEFWVKFFFFFPSSLPKKTDGRSCVTRMDSQAGAAAVMDRVSRKETAKSPAYYIYIYIYTTFFLFIPIASHLHIWAQCGDFFFFF